MNRVSQADMGDHDAAALGQTVGIHRLGRTSGMVGGPQQDFAEQANPLASDTAQIDIERFHTVLRQPQRVIAPAGQVCRQEPSPMHNSRLTVTEPSAPRVKLGQANSSTQT